MEDYIQVHLPRDTHSAIVTALSAVLRDKSSLKQLEYFNKKRMNVLDRLMIGVAID